MMSSEDISNLDFRSAGMRRTSRQVFPEAAVSGAPGYVINRNSTLTRSRNEGERHEPTSMKYYAEYLSNINFVGVYFEKASDTVNVTELVTEQGGTTALCKLNKGSEELLALPAAVHRTSTEFASGASSSRLPVLRPLDLPQSVLNLPPRCICDHPLTGPKTKWRRLPSEHWAELMDLWHCHKPSEPTNGGKSLYDLALNGFHAYPGQAFFSETYFLVHQADITGTQHSAKCPLADNSGLDSSTMKSVKLWKWDLEKGPVGRLVSEILRELIDAHAVYTYEINRELLIWVFNPAVIYTVTGAGSPARGCKLFYGRAAELKQQRPDAEVVDLPESVYRALLDELAVSNARLPGSVQAMGRWRLAVI